MARTTQNRCLLIVMSLAAGLALFSVTVSFMATLDRPTSPGFVYADPAQ